MKLQLSHPLLVQLESNLKAEVLDMKAGVSRTQHQRIVTVAEK